MTSNNDSHQNVPQDGSSLLRGSQDEWDCCPSGELQRMVDRLNVLQRCAERKRTCYCGAVAMLLVAGVVLGGTWVTIGSGANRGLTCKECQSHFASYRAHLAGDSLMEDTALTERMATHLAHCSSCRSQFNASYPGLLADRHPGLALPALPMFAVNRRVAGY